MPILAQPRIANLAPPSTDVGPLTTPAEPVPVTVRVVWASTGEVQHLDGMARAWRPDRVLVQGLRPPGAAVSWGGWFLVADVRRQGMERPRHPEG